jgi:hypothetical protein
MYPGMYDIFLEMLLQVLILLDSMSSGYSTFMNCSDIEFVINQNIKYENILNAMLSN